MVAVAVKTAQLDPLPAGAMHHQPKEALKVADANAGTATLLALRRRVQSSARDLKGLHAMTISRQRNHRKMKRQPKSKDALSLSEGELVHSAIACSVQPISACI